MKRDLPLNWSFVFSLTLFFSHLNEVISLKGFVLSKSIIVGLGCEVSWTIGLMIQKGFPDLGGDLPFHTASIKGLALLFRQDFSDLVVCGRLLGIRRKAVH